MLSVCLPQRIATRLNPRACAIPVITAICFSLQCRNSSRLPEVRRAMTFVEAQAETTTQVSPCPTKKARTDPTCSQDKLRVQKLSDKAVLPIRGSDGAAGYDLSSAEDCIIPARGKYMVNTDLKLAIPPTCYGRVAPRSGLAWKYSIDTGAGVIDSDYRGPLKVILFNFSDVDFQVKQGDRIAQLILEKIMIAEVAEVQELDETIRGEGGIGSTGGFATTS